MFNSGTNRFVNEVPTPSLEIGGNGGAIQVWVSLLFNV